MFSYISNNTVAIALLNVINFNKLYYTLKFQILLNFSGIGLCKPAK